MDGRRDALSRFGIDVAGRAGRGGAETLILVTRLRLESSPHPPACPSNTTGVKRMPCCWHRLAVLLIVGSRGAGRRQEVSAKSQASGSPNVGGSVEPGTGLLRMGRRRRGRPAGHVPDRTRDKECLGHGKGMRSVRIPVKEEGVGPLQQPSSSAPLGGTSFWSRLRHGTEGGDHASPWPLIRSRSLEVRRPRRSAP